MTALCPFCGATDEIWRPVASWPGFEFSSAAGRIKSPSGRVLAQRPSNRPREAPADRRYRLVNLCLGGRKQTVTVHSMILMAHGDETHPAGARPAGMEVSHKDDNPAHNCVSNLCWETHPENEGRKPPGQHRRAGQIGYATRNKATSQPVTEDVTGVPGRHKSDLRKPEDRARARARVGTRVQQPVTYGTPGPVGTLRRLLRRVTRRG